MEYINGEDGIVARWLNAGAAGWRLDVADELPDGFLDALRTRVKATDPDALVLG
jgi:glycosidase